MGTSKEFATEFGKTINTFDGQLEAEADVVTAPIAEHGAVDAMGIKEAVADELEPLVEIDVEVRLKTPEDDWSEKEKAEFWDLEWKKKKEALKDLHTKIAGGPRTFYDISKLSLDAYKTSFWYPKRPRLHTGQKLRKAQPIIDEIVRTVTSSFRAAAGTIASGLTFQATTLQEQGELHARYTRLYGRVKDSPDSNLRCGSPGLKKKCEEARAKVSEATNGKA